MRGIWPVKNGLPFQSCRHHLISRILIDTSPHEQGAGVLSGLEQPRYQRWGPYPKRVRLTLGFQPVFEPRRHWAIGSPSQYSQASEQVLVQLAGFTPRGQYLNGRGPVAGLRLGHD